MPSCVVSGALIQAEEAIGLVERSVDEMMEDTIEGASPLRRTVLEPRAEHNCCGGRRDTARSWQGLHSTEAAVLALVQADHRKREDILDDPADPIRKVGRAVATAASDVAQVVQQDLCSLEVVRIG